VAIEAALYLRQPAAFRNRLGIRGQGHRRRRKRDVLVLNRFEFQNHGGGGDRQNQHKAQEAFPNTFSHRIPWVILLVFTNINLAFANLQEQGLDLFHAETREKLDQAPARP
jgi:hypothetical protein